MSKINVFRGININYNNNANRIEDETFVFSGEHTMLSLQNGGGKTVLVQMMMAPFVHKRYRDTPDRPFDSFFTTNRPSYLMIEWLLDGGAGYVLTGMMVRKRQSGTETDSSEELDMINFIYEYREANEYDIHSIPVIEQDGSEKKLKGFNATRQLFEEIRQKKGAVFQSFDMTQSNQQRYYFSRLKEFGIDSDEWEAIVKKINIKESGLSELFREAKDEKGLIEKWFLPAIEKKLNKEENRVKQFQKLLQKFIVQYKENEVKIKRKEAILEFEEDAKKLNNLVEKSIELTEKVNTEQERIAYLRYQIKEMVREKESETLEFNTNIEHLESKLTDIGYEEISYELHQLYDALDILTYEQNQAEQEMNKWKEKKKQVEKLRNILLCAKAFEKYQREEKELLLLENQYEVLKQDEAKTLPERQDYGYSLRLAYEEKIVKFELECNKLEEKLSNLKKEQELLQKDAAEIRNQLEQLGHEEGSLHEKIKQYDTEESRYCEEYSIPLERNILGTYEDGCFEVLLKNQVKQKEQLEHELVLAKSKQKNSEEKGESLQRQMQDTNALLGELKQKLIVVREREESFQEQLEIRLRFMQYLSIKEEKQYDRDYICEKFGEKLTELHLMYKKLERESEKAEEEYYKLKNGVVLEIPEEFRQLLNSLDINYVFGMEYLKNIGYGEEQNRELLETMPLLPYSIIMERKELAKLEQAPITFFTSYPIPIVMKEQLKLAKSKKQNGIYRGEQVSFFVMFNKHLLNPKELTLLIKNQEEQIKICKLKKDKKQEEINHYEMMCQTIIHQELTKESYDFLQKQIRQTKQEEKDAQSAMLEYRMKKSDNDKFLHMVTEDIKSLSEEKTKAERLLLSTNQLQTKYESYLNSKMESTYLKKKIEKLKQTEKEKLERQEKVYYELGEEGESHSRKKVSLKEAKEQHNRYKQYDKGNKISKDLNDLEARYNVITQNLQTDVKQLEKQIIKARENFDYAQQDLVELSKDCQILDLEYRDISYDKHRMDELSSQLKELDKEMKRSDDKWNDFDKEAAIKESKIKDKLQILEEKFQKTELKPKEQIVDIEFKTRIKLLKASIKDAVQKKNESALRKNGYEASLTALAEFESFTYSKEYLFEEELSLYYKTDMRDLEQQELEKLHVSVVREYRSFVKKQAEHILWMEKQIDILLRKEKFQDEFYHQPLTLIHDLVSEPENLKKQLEITLTSYQTLLEKIEVDIAFVDKEKTKIIEMLLDYVEEIHKNLERIDRNSSIPIKNRTIKMLKIQVQPWEENKEIYMQRVIHFILELTKSGLECMEQNGNLEEMIGFRVTSKQLYDMVVGIGTAVIKLYKIESQREYPITWTQVSKNSGGEGFLSAFVVLASLLSYMRRDESDLFVEREEGKVLIMDNPFAQTNASHLLIPIMEIAKKYNTQLICLTGLGGESIYNRFDNIYVLNLIESGIQRDIQYLKAEHVKGDTKIYELTSARMQIENTEQMELIF